MNKKILVTSTMLMLSAITVNAQNDITSLVKTLNQRGYVVDEDIKDQKVLERYLALDTRLTNKHDSIANILKSLEGYAAYIDKSQESDELLNKVRSLMGRGKEIKDYFRYKRSFDGYTPFLDKYEKAINGFDKLTDTKDIDFITNTFKSLKIKFQKDSIIAAKIELDSKNELSSLPTKLAVKAKFRTYTHKTGYVFEMFPVNFTPKVGKPLIDRVFGRKARYREVDSNGMNTFIIDFYDSGSIKNVTVYKGSGTVYYAEYRDKAKNPYEIRSTSVDGKFYVVYKRIYDMHDDKTTVTTKYQYVPLDYWYD